MCERIQTGSLRVAKVLHDFINDEALPGTGVDAASFWPALEAIIDDLAPRNRALLAKRDELQARIDAWYREHQTPVRPRSLQKLPARDRLPRARGRGFFRHHGQQVDPEISTIAGPQLVVPVMNARYALNAANARWGSLYDALYGTDAIADDGAARGPGYNPERGARVIAFARDFLDEVAPLAQGSHRDARGYAVEAGRLVVQLERGATGLQAAGKVRRLSGRCREPFGGPAGQPRPAHRDPHRPRAIRSARTTRPASPTSCWRRRSPRSWTARIRSPRSMPRTRSRSIATGWA